MKELETILQKFPIEGNIISIAPYGEGHINQTFLAVTDRKRYILQKINTKLFRNVERLMNNIMLVTEYNRTVTKAKGLDPDDYCLSLVYTHDKKNYFYDESGDYRVYKYLENSVCYQTVSQPGLFYESAVAFGNFASLLAQFDATKLYEILPDFHNTEKRFTDFTRAVLRDPLGRRAETETEIAFINDRDYLYKTITDLLKSGVMPTKVTHNDTKLNNVLFDERTGKAMAVIDLDTIMPGSICYDFGDSIRFGCNPALEDERDLSKVNFQLPLFEEYTKGYLYSLGSSITSVEKDNLAIGAILMTLECGMRFLADYLEGDTYFHTSRPKQNLDRCRTQLKLVADMEDAYERMQHIVSTYYEIYCK